MHLSPREQEKLLIVVAADLARRRRDRGVKLNHPEAIAIITAEIMEGVPEMIHEVQVEATFPDGTKLVTVHNPVR